MSGTVSALATHAYIIVIAALTVGGSSCGLGGGGAQGWRPMRSEGGGIPHPTATPNSPQPLTLDDIATPTNELAF